MAVDLTKPYDDNNIFARILRGELPCTKIHEDAHTLAFHDIHPQAPTHALVIPKGRYVSWNDFAATATDTEIAAFTRAIALVAKQLGVADAGYRLLANIGQHGHQEVPHLHVHILAGRQMGVMLAG